MKVVFWVLWMTALYVGVWYGAFVGVEWAANVVRFAIWSTVAIQVGITSICFVGWVVLDPSKMGSYFGAKMPGPTQQAADHTLDVALCLIMAAGGWHVTAAAYLVQVLATYTLLHIARDVRPA